MGVPMKITARLSAPIVGDPPHLDALLEWTMARKMSSVAATDARGAHPDFNLVLSRGDPPPPMGFIPIPVERGRLGKFAVARCSSPILVGTRHEYVARMAKRVDPANAVLLAEGERRTINHAAGPTKAYFLPQRARTVDAVVWFAVCYGERRDAGDDRRRSPEASLRRLLKRVRALGKHHKIGYGQVAAWETERVESDCSWFAESEMGQVLMRPLPVGPWLPADLVGARVSFGACCPPYWHPERYTEVVWPC